MQLKNTRALDFMRGPQERQHARKNRMRFYHARVLPRRRLVLQLVPSPQKEKSPNWLFFIIKYLGIERQAFDPQIS